jgi:hypothetical protein
MATLHITEFSTLPRDANGNTLQIGKMTTDTATQVVTYTTSTQSTAFAADTRYIRVISSAAAHLAFGTNPTATANDPWVPASTAEFFAVNAADELAAYDGTS